MNAPRVVGVRLAEGDFSGGQARLRLRHGTGPVTELTLRPGAASGRFEYRAEPGTANPREYAIEVEYQWGYGREAWFKGSAEADELVVPFPGSTGAASFPFPRR